MFDNVYLNSLLIILAVFILTGGIIFLYDFLVNKNKLIKPWDINLREYSLYIKYSYKTKKFTIEGFQKLELEGIEKLKEYIQTEEFHSSVLEAKKSEHGTFRYAVKYSHYEIQYMFTIKDTTSSSVILKCDVLNQDRKDSIYLKTLDDLKMEHSMAKNKKAGFFYVNIKDFNALNQRYGRVYGDYILEILRNRLNSIHKYKCSAAYVGSAQYAVYVNKKFSKRSAIKFANYIVKVLTKPVDEKYLMFDISVGIGVCIGEYTDFNDFVKNSYVAGDYAKHRANYNIILYTNAMESEDNLVITCQREVDKIVNQGKIEFNYCPVYNPKKNKYIGYISNPMFKNMLIDLNRVKQSAVQMDKADQLMTTIYRKQFLTFIKRRPSKLSRLVINARLEDLSSLIEVYFSERSFQECKVILCLDVKKGYEMINKFSNISSNISRLLNGGVELATIINHNNMYEYDYVLRISDYLVLDREVLNSTKSNTIEDRLLHMVELAKNYNLSLFAIDVDEYLEFEKLLKYKTEYISGRYLGDSASTPTEIEYTRTRLLSKIIKDAQKIKK